MGGEARFRPWAAHSSTLAVREVLIGELRAQDELRIHDEHLAIARQAVQAARIKYAVGNVPQQDILKAQVALTRLAEHLVHFEQDAAIARLDDMGIAPFLISSSVILACAQRLMRRICSHCKEPVVYPAKMFQDLNIDPSIFDGVTLFRGRGCDRCKNSGYAGRLAIIEAMTITDDLRKLIIARSNSRELGKVAIGQGMRTLRMVALDRVREGVSTLEQVLLLTAAH